MASAVQALAPDRRIRRDVWFAIGIIAILAILFLPVPAVLIDIGLALSIAISVLILMVALWIHKPLEFSSFPTILLIATLLRLALGIATTRLILSNGDAGVDAAGHVIQGFSQFVMSGEVEPAYLALTFTLACKLSLNFARILASIHIVIGHLAAKGAVLDVYAFGWGFTWVPWCFTRPPRLEPDPSTAQSRALTPFLTPPLTPDQVLHAIRLRAHPRPALS